MRKYTCWFSVLTVVILALSVIACTKQDLASNKPEITKENPSSQRRPLLTERDFRESIIDVAKANIPAVVHIEVTQRQEIENPLAPLSPFENDPFFRRFFDFPQMPKKFKRELRGIGTGMIINKDGYILTNYHVVAGANEIQVILSDERQYTAKVIGSDQKTDLAVIRIPANEILPTVIFGDSDKVEVGEWVVSIGHPRGLDQTVTQGIISAKHRQGITDPSTYQDFLQTDAAINPGNSGGPLLNLDGQVIGVNSIIASQSGGFEGIGFAIPSNMAIHISNSLMASGKVERGWIGLTLQDIPFEKLKELKLESTRGAYVVDVVKGGPAYSAGIKSGDVILSVDGKNIADSGELRNLVAGTPIGKEVKLGIMRGGKRMNAPVKIGNPAEAAKIMAASIRERLGVDVRPVSENEAGKYGIQPGVGAVITRLDPKGPMAAAGFETNDVLLQIEDQPIDSVEGFGSIVSALKPGQTIDVIVADHRTGRLGSIKVQVR